MLLSEVSKCLQDFNKSDAIIYLLPKLQSGADLGLPNLQSYFLSYSKWQTQDCCNIQDGTLCDNRNFITKSSILDVETVLDPPLILITSTMMTKIMARIKTSLLLHRKNYQQKSVNNNKSGRLKNKKTVYNYNFHRVVVTVLRFHY